MTTLTRATGATSLVSLIDGQAVTTSKQVAEFFGKDHAKVLRDIRSITESLPPEHQAKFGSTFIDVPGPNGAVRQSPAYRLTRDGFTLLAMGFTGKRALQFKLAYIDAFNRMEKALTTQALPSPNINPEQQRALQEAVAARAEELAPESRGRAFPKLWGAIKSHFRVGTYKDLRPDQFDEAMSLVAKLDIGSGPALPSGADPLLDSHDYRRDARNYAMDTIWALREQLPPGAKAPPPMDDATEQRIADGICASILERARWVASFIDGRLTLVPVATGAAVIDPRNPSDLESLIREHVPIQHLPGVAQAAFNRINRTLNTKEAA
ncbi:MAG: Rha family transcriptional regulator [Oceanococcaceae bacterium]